MVPSCCAVEWGSSCAESRLDCLERGRKLMMKRLLILRRCEPIVRFSCCSVQYRECRRNHAASTGGHAIDGCREFISEGEEGSGGAFKCAACGCHRSFHRRVQRRIQTQGPIWTLNEEISQFLQASNCFRSIKLVCSSYFPTMH
ncbi:hypothetical protein EJB05_43011, partial [Eragrostis curvula]